MKRGFTLIEMMVVVGIMVVLVSVIVTNLRRGQKTQQVNAASEGVVSALRQMQNNILSGLEYAADQPAGDFGFEIADAGTSYTTFVELPGEANKKNLETVNFLNDVSVDNLVVGGEAASLLQVRFFSPFGKMKMTGDGTSHTNAEDITTTFDIELSTGSVTISKTITLDGLTGRIEAQ